MGAPSSPGQHQLALPVEQRANVRRLLDSLRRRQQTACTDLEVCVCTCRCMSLYHVRVCLHISAESGTRSGLVQVFCLCIWDV